MIGQLCSVNKNGFCQEADGCENCWIYYAHLAVNDKTNMRPLKNLASVSSQNIPNKPSDISQTPQPVGAVLKRASTSPFESISKWEERIRLLEPSLPSNGALIPSQTHLRGEYYVI